MTNTYSGDPSTSDKDAVRFYLHDRQDPWLFTDEEILYSLAEQGSVLGAASEMAMVQSTKYTDMRDKTVGPLSIKYGEIGERWLKLSRDLRRRSSRGSGAVAVLTQNSRAPYFRLGQNDIIKNNNDLLGDPRDLTDYGV